MRELSKSEREDLRRAAQSLRPLVQIGKLGLTDAVLITIDQALTANQLIKVRFGGASEQQRELAEEIASRVDAALVTVIGHVAVLYRPSVDGS